LFHISGHSWNSKNVSCLKSGDFVVKEASKLFTVIFWHSFDGEGFSRSFLVIPARL